MKRGYFGIGVYRPKTSTNVGTLWRSCLEFDANFMFTVGARCMYDPAFASQASNTVQAQRHIPLFVYPTIEEMILPTDCPLIGIEQCDKSIPLENFVHPERAVYILGAEDDGIPPKVQEYCTGGIVRIATNRCLNVAVAGSIVMYDRWLKQYQKGEHNNGFQKDFDRENDYHRANATNAADGAGHAGAGHA